VVFAASPRMKKEFGVKTGTRLFKIPNHPEIRLIKPKVHFFVDLSNEEIIIATKYSRKIDSYGVGY